MAYEKERDRFIQKEGFKIFHYTGSEIVKNPFMVASEALSYICPISNKNLLKSIDIYGAIEWKKEFIYFLTIINKYPNYQKPKKPK